MAKKRYLIYRVYTREERMDPNDQIVLYGWTENKNILKAFLAQRAKKKYKVIRVEEEDIVKFFDEDVDDTDIRIDCLKLQMASSKEEFLFFTTMNEEIQAEKDIQKYFRDLASFKDLDGDGDYVQMVIHLDEYFASALFYLGYRPQDIDIMYDSASDYDDISGLHLAEDEIDYAYNIAGAFPQEEYRPSMKPLGLNTLSDISAKILYSLENFVKVLREEL